MTKFQRAPQSEVQLSEWRTPAEVLFKRNGGVSGGSPARGSVLPISSGFRVEQSKRGFSSVCCVSRVRCVGSVSVSGFVASRLRPVASASGLSPEDLTFPENAKNVLLRTLRQSRRTTAAIQFERMQQRFTSQTVREVQRQLRSSSVASVAFSQFELRQSESGSAASSSSEWRSRQLSSSELRQSSLGARPLRERSSQLRPVQSASCVGNVPVVSAYSVRVASGVQPEIAESVSEMSKVASVAFRTSAQSAVKPVASRELVQSRSSVSRERLVVASVAPVGSVQSSAGEWRQVGDALSSVLGRVRAVAEASAQMEKSDGKERMH